MKNHGSKKVVIMAGGTGQSRVLKALKDDIDQLSAIVTMADDGGSTGRLRKYHNAPAVGDLRQCLTALGEPANVWVKLFPFRFGNNRWGEGAQDIEGHVVGNIILVALVDTLGGLRQAVAAAAREMQVKPTHGVFPATFENIVLHATLGNGNEIAGQYNISHKVPRAKKFRIAKVWLEAQPKKDQPIAANPDAIQKINEADVILIGPGALHGSVLPNLLISEIKNAILKSKARKIYLANTAIKLSETRGFSLEDHLMQLVSHTDAKLIDEVLVNSKKVKTDKGVKLLTTDKSQLVGYPVHLADVIDEDNIFTHDPAKLRKVLLDLIA